jgi:hypothetical protein
MRLQRHLLLGAFALLGATVACSSSDVTRAETQLGPYAFVRYVNAMPDTGAVDVHAVDVVENFNGGLGVAYRTVTPYTGIAPGSRHFSVFPTSTDINVTSKVILDTTITFQANTYYTILHTGYARAGATPKQRWVIITDNIPTPGASQIGLRAVVAAPNLGPLDVYSSSTGGTAPLPASASFPNVAYGTPSAYVNFATGANVLRATASGSNTPVVVESTVPVGAPATAATTNPTAGTSYAGSVLTAFYFPAGVAGSPAASFTTPGVTYAVDRRPK